MRNRAIKEEIHAQYFSQCMDSIFLKSFIFLDGLPWKTRLFKITMFLQVDYERVKISFVIHVFNPPEWSPCAFASTTGLCLWQPSKSGVLTQTQNSICKHIWSISNSRVHSSPGPAFYSSTVWCHQEKHSSQKMQGIIFMSYSKEISKDMCEE